MTRSKNSTKLVALLMSLVLITSCFVGGTLARYITSTSSEDSARVAVWGINADEVEMDLFDAQYELDGTVVAKANDGDNIIAPGTGKMSKFSIVNLDDTLAPEVMYEIRIDLDDTEIDQRILDNPSIQWKLDNNNWGTWTDTKADILALSGDASGVKTYAPNEIATEFANGVEHTIAWQWMLDDNNVQDTAMGNEAIDEDIFAKIVVKVTAVQTNGGRTPDIIFNPSTYIIGQNSIVNFKSEAPLNEFESVTINGTEINASDYTLTEGSTIVTFGNNYFDGFSEGSYTISINSASGSKEFVLNIVNSIITDFDWSEKGYYTNENGKIVSTQYTTDYYTSKIIPVIPGKTYSLHSTSEVWGNNGTIMYLNKDKKGNYVSFNYSQNNTFVYNITIPENIYYVALNVKTHKPYKMETEIINIKNTDYNPLTYILNSKKLVKLISERPFNKFKNITINENVISPSNYTLREGSTVVIFNEGFFDNYEADSYNIKLNFENGYSEFTLNIVDKIIDEFNWSEKDYYRNINGKIVSTQYTTDYYASDIISVVPGQTYTLYSNGETYIQIMKYNREKQNATIQENTFFSSLEYTIPENIYYIALNIRKNKPYKMEAHIELNSDLKIVNLGDSIFGMVRDLTSISNNLSNILNANVYNGSFGGCQLTDRTEASWSPFSLVNIADAIASNDYTLQEEKMVDTVPSYFATHINTLKNVDFNDVDIITISYGTNDFTANDTISNDDRYDVNTVKGALRQSIETIQEAYPHIKIVICTPLWRYKMDEDTFIGAETWTNSSGKKLEDYVDAIKEIADEYNLTVCDFYNEIDLNEENKDTVLSSDGTHPNANGRLIIAQTLANTLQSIID